MNKYYAVKIPSALSDRNCVLGVGTTQNNAIEAAYGSVAEGKLQMRVTKAFTVEITEEEFSENV